ncbi:MAG TPA: LPS export ABC transporter permease LptF [Gammaproteobacteria bacterium]|nr:LPS export ABC transporter permease LptF [Gammaproteobacteria bacterium]
MSFIKSSILSRYLLKEAGLTSLAVSAVLTGVLFTNSLIRLLGQAAQNNLPSSGILSLLGLATLGYFSYLLPAGLLLGMVLTFGRMYRDNEMPVLAACGIGPWRLLRELLWLALPAVLLVTWLALTVAPWALHKAANVQAVLQQSLEVESIRAGRFLTSKRAQGMLYVENMTADGEMQDVFLETQRNGETILVSASTARRETDPATGASFLVLRDGYRVEGVPGEQRWRILQFEEHGVRLSKGPLPDVRIKQSAVPTQELLQRGRPADIAELQRRLSAPLMVLVLTLLTVPLSKTAPREGRYGRLLTAVLLFVVYFSLLNISVDGVKTGRLSPWIGVWWVHVAMAALSLAWLRHSFGVLRFERRRQA